ncbi:MAG: hypothetical protein ACXVQY_02420 [Actinomycetota bacterium]
MSAPDAIVLDEVGESPTVEVRVWRYGKLVHRELCESVEIAADLVDTWSEIEGVECEVDDMSARHGDEEVLEPTAGEFADANNDRARDPRQG